MNTEAANRCRTWLEEQLEHLRGLRNGNPRDAQFKQWRQSTLTVMQRIWPGESTRSERFRRIRFTSPQSRVDARTVSDWFTRGCDEAASQLTALIAEIDREGVPASAAIETAADDPHAIGPEDEAYPTLDLNAAKSPESVGIPADRDIVLDLGGGGGDAPPVVPPREATGDAAPPTLRVSVNARNARNGGKGAPKAPVPMGRPAAAEPAAKEPPAPSAPAPRASEPARPRGSRRAAGKGRLRDLLGLDDVIARVREEEPPAAPTPTAAAPAPPEPTPAEPEPTPVMPAHAEAAAEPTPTPEPEFTKAAVDDALARISPRPRKAAPAPPAPPKTEPVAAEPVAPEAPLAAPAPPATATVVPEEPTVVTTESDASVSAFVDAGSSAIVADEAEPTSDVAEAAEAEAETQRFFDTSPVLSLVGRPVHRRTDVTRFEQPDAVALATLADDAGRLGVPEDRREAVRQSLVELAGRLESGDPDWHLLAEVVREAMLHRELAERLMPVLLPWLTRAA